MAKAYWIVRRLVIQNSELIGVPDSYVGLRGQWPTLEPDPDCTGGGNEDAGQDQS